MPRSTKVFVSTLAVLFGYIALSGPSAFPADNQAQAIVGARRFHVGAIEIAIYNLQLSGALSTLSISNHQIPVLVPSEHL